MSTKKAFTIFSLILILAMLISACGAQPTPAPASDRRASADDGARSRREWLEDDLCHRAAGGESVLWRDAGDRGEEG